MNDIDQKFPGDWPPPDPFWQGFFNQFHPQVIKMFWQQAQTNLFLREVQPIPAPPAQPAADPQPATPPAEVDPKQRKDRIDNEEIARLVIHLKNHGAEGLFGDDEGQN